MSLQEFVSEHKAALGAAAVFLGILWGSDMAPELSIPLEWRVLGTFMTVAGLGGYFVGSWLGIGEDQIDWHVIKQVNAADSGKLPDYKLSPEAFEELTVVGGELKHLPEHTRPTYECRYFDADNLTAHVTWRGVPDGSELLGARIGDVLEEIETMRESYEQPVRWGSAIRNGLPAIIRKIEYERMVRQNAALERHMTPDMGGSTIDEYVAETIPDEALPKQLRSDAADRSSAVDQDDVVDDVQDSIDDVVDDALQEAGGPMPAEADD